ncbi:MAG: hypothetical protein QY323_05315 [Patescibacteria group bacterium]|nr:MAG: hypothetical protein QY323_05315 [Patescibacteria group bacterium]
MPPGALFFLGLVALIVIAIFVRWIVVRYAEWRLRKPLSAKLDWLIAQVKYHEATPLQDLRVIHIGASPGVDDPNDTSTHYEICPLYGHYFSVAHIGAGKKLRYRVNRWRDDMYGPIFPPLGGTCRSPWFVERMETLCKLLDAYPRGKLLARISDRTHGTDPDPGPDLLPAA